MSGLGNVKSVFSGPIGYCHVALPLYPRPAWRGREILGIGIGLNLGRKFPLEAPTILVGPNN